MVGARIANLGKGGDRRSEDFKGSNDLLKSQSDAAEMMNVSVPSVKRAAVVQRTGAPELVAAVEYAIHSQRDRRNLSDADLLRWIEEVDKRRKAGRPEGGEEKLPSVEGNKKRQERASSAETAAVVGTSARKVEQARTVIDKGTANGVRCSTACTRLITSSCPRAARARRAACASTRDGLGGIRLGLVVGSKQQWLPKLLR